MKMDYQSQNFHNIGRVKMDSTVWGYQEEDFMGLHLMLKT